MRARWTKTWDCANDFNLFPSATLLKLSSLPVFFVKWTNSLFFIFTSFSAKQKAESWTGNTQNPTNRENDEGLFIHDWLFFPFWGDNTNYIFQETIHKYNKTSQTRWLQFLVSDKLLYSFNIIISYAMYGSNVYIFFFILAM